MAVSKRKMRHVHFMIPDKLLESLQEYQEDEQKGQGEAIRHLLGWALEERKYQKEYQAS